MTQSAPRHPHKFSARPRRPKYSDRTTAAHHSPIARNARDPSPIASANPRASLPASNPRSAGSNNPRGGPNLLPGPAAPAGSICPAYYFPPKSAPPARAHPAAVEIEYAPPPRSPAAGKEIFLARAKPPPAPGWPAPSPLPESALLPAPAGSTAGLPGSPSPAPSPAPQKNDTPPPSAHAPRKCAAGTATLHLPDPPSHCESSPNSALPHAAAPRCAMKPARPFRCTPAPVPSKSAGCVLIAEPQGS